MSIKVLDLSSDTAWLFVIDWRKSTFNLNSQVPLRFESMQMDKSTMQAAAAQIEDHFRQYANDSTEDIQEVKVRRSRIMSFQIRFSGTRSAKFSYLSSCFTVTAKHRDLYTRLLKYKAWQLPLLLSPCRRLQRRFYSNVALALHVSPHERRPQFICVWGLTCMIHLFSRYVVGTVWATTSFLDDSKGQTCVLFKY